MNLYRLFSFPSSFSKWAVVFLLVTVVGLASCGGRRKAPDVSGVAVNLSVRHLERDLFGLDTNALGAGLIQLNKTYPDFLNFYLDTLMGFDIRGNFVESDSGVQQGLRLFLTHPDYRGVFDSVAAHYPDTKSIEADLQHGYQYYRHYFPGKDVKKVVFFCSGLNKWNAITYSDILGIGLDMYLGPKYPFYAAVEIPAYYTQRLKPEFIPVDAFISIYREDYPFEAENHTLLDQMVQRGKEQYFLEQVLPFTNDTLRFGYTAREMEWCRNSEAQLYNFFVAQNLLYETNLLKVSRYVNEGPGDARLPEGAPGNVGTFVGYQIVKAYMEKHPDMPMEKLLPFSDAQVFLQESGYKPR